MVMMTGPQKVEGQLSPSMMLHFLKFFVLMDFPGVSSRKDPSTTGTNGNSAMPKTMPFHSALTNSVAFFVRRQSITALKFFRS